MKISVIGESKHIENFKSSIPTELEVEAISYPMLEDYDFSNQKVIVDLNLDDYPENLLYYASAKGAVVVGCAVKKSLREMLQSLPDVFQPTIIGINSIIGLNNQTIKELSFINENDKNVATEIFEAFNWQIRYVEDRVGMVTPRVICMIINEAFYTYQEGTASIKDIDESMKLGVNYPKGPFEWCNLIGIKEVYEILTALYDDTKEERYKVCAKLKSYYLENKVIEIV
jgi:3-hydroxybutyryl-CoA dehydrogenase